MSLAARQNARTQPDEMALSDERMTLTWAELDALLNRATNALLARKGDAANRVAIFATNSVETIVAYLADMHAGVSSVPVNFHFTADEVAYILRDSGADTLFVGPETLATGLKAAAQAGVRTVVGWRCPETAGLTPWQTWVGEVSEAEPPVDTAARPHLHYTSGTTGRPKGTETPPTMFPQARTVAELFEILVQQAAEAGNLSPSMVVGPLYHTGPLSSVRTLGGGRSVVVLSRFDPEVCLSTIQTHRVRTTLMVPTHFQRLLSLPPETKAKYDVSSMAMITHTGAACPRDVKRAMIEWFGPILSESYGATESGTTNRITSEEWLRKPGSVGKTQPQFELLVIAEDGSRLGPNQVGQLYFRDKSGRGIIYHNDPEKTRSAHLEPGVFTLGELGHFDDDGYVFITDRISDMIVSGGVNIYPAEIEQVLLRHPEVADVAVVGAPNQEMGEEAKAVIVPRRLESPPASEELDRFCREHLAGFKCPRSYEFMADIGRNAMGKVNKRELRKRFWPTERTIGG